MPPFLLLFSITTAAIKAASQFLHYNPFFKICLMSAATFAIQYPIYAASNTARHYTQITDIRTYRLCLHSLKV